MTESTEADIVGAVPAVLLQLTALVMEVPPKPYKCVKTL